MNYSFIEQPMRRQLFNTDMIFARSLQIYVVTLTLCFKQKVFQQIYDYDIHALGLHFNGMIFTASRRMKLHVSEITCLIPKFWGWIKFRESNYYSSYATYWPILLANFGQLDPQVLA
jgi:hypothetical protein